MRSASKDLDLSNSAFLSNWGKTCVISFRLSIDGDSNLLASGPSSNFPISKVSPSILNIDSYLRFSVSFKTLLNFAGDFSLTLLSSMMSGKPNNQIQKLVNNVTKKIEHKINSGQIDKTLLESQAKDILNQFQNNPENPIIENPIIENPIIENTTENKQINNKYAYKVFYYSISMTFNC